MPFEIGSEASTSKDSVCFLILSCNMALTYQQMSPLPTQNCVGISNKKTAGDNGCKGDKKDGTLAFPLHEGTGEKKAMEVTIPVCYPFSKCLERH